jgi:hypothetical protein
MFISTRKKKGWQLGKDETVPVSFVSRRYLPPLLNSQFRARPTLTAITCCLYMRSGHSLLGICSFEVAFGRVKSEALRDAMGFLISGEFARGFEKAISSSKPKISSVCSPFYQRKPKVRLHVSGVNSPGTAISRSVTCIILLSCSSICSPRGVSTKP